MGAKNSGIDDQLFAYIVSSINNTPFYKLLGVSINELGPGYAELNVIPNKEHTNPLGLVHGGLLMSIADAAMGNAIRSLGIRAVTVDCSMGFIAAASLGETLIARGKIIKAGKNLIFSEATVYAADKVIVTSKATFFKTGEIHL